MWVQCSFMLIRELQLCKETKVLFHGILYISCFTLTNIDSFAQAGRLSAWNRKAMGVLQFTERFKH